MNTFIRRATVCARLLAPTGWLMLPVLSVVLSVVLPTRAAAATQADPVTWQLPLPDTPVVIRAFDPPASQWSAGHRGVDLAAAVGTDVLAAGDGVVSFAGQVAGQQVVVVRHGELRTTYLPVRATVAVGTRVRGGQVIGRLLGGTHCGGRPCLHWGLLRGEQYLDPMSLLRSGHAHLVPVWTAVPSPPDRGGSGASSEPEASATGPPDSHSVPPASSAGDGSHRSAWPVALGGAAGVAVATAAAVVRRRMRRAPVP